MKLDLFVMTMSMNTLLK